MSTIRFLVLISAVAGLAGCATQHPSATGRHLVYRDSGGAALRQFDYPSPDICRRVEAVADKTAKCQPESVVSQMKARATLRYNPPNMLVEAHYSDLARCQTETTKLGAGVELVTACAAAQ